MKNIDEFDWWVDDRGKMSEIPSDIGIVFEVCEVFGDCRSRKWHKWECT